MMSIYQVCWDLPQHSIVPPFGKWNEKYWLFSHETNDSSWFRFHILFTRSQGAARKARNKKIIEFVAVKQSVCYIFYSLTDWAERLQNVLQQLKRSNEIW